METIEVVIFLPVRNATTSKVFDAVLEQIRRLSTSTKQSSNSSAGWCLLGTTWKPGLLKYWHANGVPESPLYSVWPAGEAENCSPSLSQCFSCGVLIYQLAAALQQSCHRRWIKQEKSILSCHVMREQIQYVLKADGGRQGLCLNARHFCRGMWAQLGERGSLLSLGLPARCSVSLIVPHGWMWLSAVLQEGKATTMWTKQVVHNEASCLRSIDPEIKRYSHLCVSTPSL